MNKIILTIALSFCVYSGILKAQTQNPAPQTPAPSPTVAPQVQQQTSAPLELPDVIITGKEQIELPNSQKKMPSKPKKLNSRQLEFLNPLEKSRESLLEVDKNPSEPIFRKRRNGFLNAEIGRFTTADVEAGYGFVLGSYSLFADAGVDYSAGHVNDADYHKIYGRITSDYIAPDKYYIFGGSRTRAQLFFNSNAYNLYADTLVPKRDINSFKAKIETEGAFEGYNFLLGGAWFNENLKQSSETSSENNLDGYLTIKTNIDQYEVGGGACVDFGTFRGHSVNFMQLDGLCGFNYKTVMLELKGGLQSATNSADINRSGLFLQADGKYYIDENFLLKVGLFSGLEKTFFNEMLEINPYVSALSKVDFAYDKIGIRGYLHYNPNPRLNATIGLKYDNYDRFAVYESDGQGSFNTGYAKISKLEFSVATFYNLTNYDAISAGITFTNASLVDSSKTAPYFPSVKFGATYQKDWRNSFKTKFGIDFSTKRYADCANNKSLDGFINLKASAEYKFDKNFITFLKTENLTNSNIMVWEGYKERGFFISIGALWQFD